MSDNDEKLDRPRYWRESRRSHSQFDKFSGCGERFRLEKTVYPRLPKRPAAWLAHGNAFHVTYQQWELSGRKIDFRERYLENYELELDKLREQQPDYNLWLKPPRVRRVVEHIETQRERGLDQVDTFLDLMEGADWWPYCHPETETPAVELEFEIKLGEITIVGFIDYVREHNEGYSVLDFKTGNRVETYIQLGLYKLVIEEQLGIKITHGEYFYTKDCSLSNPIDLSRYTREYLTDVYSALERGIQNEVFLPTPGKGCELCSVKKFCREMGDTPIPLDWEEQGNIWWTVDGSE